MTILNITKLKYLFLLSLWVIITQSTCFAESNNSSQNLVKEAWRLWADGGEEDELKVQSLFANAIRQDPYSLDAHLGLAEYTMFMISHGKISVKALESAAQLIQHMQLIYPNEPGPQLAFAEMMVWFGQEDSALKLLSSLKERYPNHKDTYYFETKILAGKDKQKAFASAKKAISKGVSLDRLLYPLMRIFENHTNGIEPEDIENFATAFPHRWLWHHAGLNYLKQKKFKKAISSFENAIKAGNRFESSIQLAILKDSFENKTKEAFAFLNSTFISLSRENLEKENSIKHSLFYLTLFALKLNKIQDAENFIYQGLALTSSNIFSLHELAEHLKKNLHNSKYALVYSILKQPVLTVLKDNPSQFETHMLLGDIYLYEHKYPESILSYSSAISLEPQSAQLKLKKARALSLLRDYPAAFEEVKEAIIIDTNIFNIIQDYKELNFLKEKEPYNDWLKSFILESNGTKLNNEKI